MCGRVIADLSPQQWALLGVPAPSVPARYNATRGATLGLVLHDGEQRVVKEARWGLVPTGMSQADADRLALFNARLETAHSKPAFRDAYRQRRALLGVQGWMEWRPGPPGEKKVPYLVRRVDGKPIVLAALYTPFEGRVTFALLTQPASPSLAWLHHRQPVPVRSGEWEGWLMAQPDALNPLPSRVFEVVPLDQVVNDGRIDHPGVIQVIGPAVPGAA